MITLVLAFLLISSSASAVSTFTGFDDSNLWETAISGTGPWVTVINATTVEMGLPKTSSGGSTFTAALDSKFKVSGDFDYAITYELINWPTPKNGVRMGIGFTSGAVERVSHESWGEVYLTDFGGILTWVATTDTSGILRIVRTGNTVTGYFWQGSDWQAIGSRTFGSAPDTSFSLAIWSHPGLFKPQDQDITVRFSSVPLPSGLLLLGSGLLGLWASGRRRAVSSRQ